MNRQEVIKDCIDKTMAIKDKDGISNTSAIERMMYEIMANALSDENLFNLQKAIDKIYNEKNN